VECGATLRFCLGVRHGSCKRPFELKVPN